MTPPPPVGPSTALRDASTISASLASLSLSRTHLADSTAASTQSPSGSTTSTPTVAATSSASQPSAVHQFNSLIREIKQLKKHTACAIHTLDHDGATTADNSQQCDTSTTATESSCPCRTLLQRYERALALASTIHTASSAATREQLVDRIAQLSATLLPPLQPVDSRYTLHRPSNHYLLTIARSKQQYRMPAELYDRLYDYQRESVHWMCQLHADGSGGILGDDMGLGKTVQVSALLSVLYSSRLAHHALLVVPSSLIDNWRAELSKWCPTLPLHLYTETPERRARRLQQCLDTGGVLLSTYGVLASLRDTPFDALVLDEGHRIKNPDTQQTRQVKALDCRYRILCTGTVVQNRLTELWCVMDFACGGRLLGERREFKEQWSDVIEEGRHKGASVEERRLSDELSRKLSELIRPFIMRRTKEEIKQRSAKQQQAQEQLRLEAAAAGASAPPPPSASTPELRVQKNELVVWLYPSEAQRRLYSALLSAGSEVMKHAQQALSLKRRPLDAMSLLRTLCSHPRLVRTSHKLCVGLPSDVFVPEASEAAARAELIVAESEKVRLLLLLLDEHRRGGHRTLVFSWSVQMLDLVSTVLQQRAIPYLRIDGQVPRAKRTATIDAFRQPDCAASVFLLSTGVGGVGLNLTAADRCVILDPDWNPATDAQSVDRCYRIGQAQNVVVHRFVTVGTIEEIVYRKQVFKQALTRLVQGGEQPPEAGQAAWMDGDDEGAGGARFTREELRGMFKQQDYQFSATQRQLAAMYPPHLRHSYPALDAHIERLSRHDIFGVTDHDLLSDHAANSHRHQQPHAQADELAVRRERANAASQRAKQRAETATQRLQQYVPQPPAWPSTNKRKGKADVEEYKDHAEDDGEAEDWRGAVRRAESEEEKTAEWIDDAEDEDDEHEGEEAGGAEHHWAGGGGEQAEAGWTQPPPYDSPMRAAEDDYSANCDDSDAADRGDAVEAEESVPERGADTADESDDGDLQDASIDARQLHNQDQEDEERERQGENDDGYQPDSRSTAVRGERDGSEDAAEQQPNWEAAGIATHSFPAGEQDCESVDVPRRDEARDEETESSRDGEEEQGEGAEREEPAREAEESKENDVADDRCESGVESDEADAHDADDANDSDVSGAEQPTDEERDCTEAHGDDQHDDGVQHEGESRHEVEAVLDKRSTDGRVEYRVRWKGCGPADDTWQAVDTLACDALIAEFEDGWRASAASEAGEAGDECEEEADERVVVDDAVEAEGEKGEEEGEEEEENIGESVDGNGAIDAERLVDGQEDRMDEDGTEQGGQDEAQTPSSDRRLPQPTAMALEDHATSEPADDVEALAGALAHLAVSAPESGEAYAYAQARSSEAESEGADEHVEWAEAREWAEDGSAGHSTPASARSANLVPATPVRLHVHASVARLLEDDGEPTSAATWCRTPFSAPPFDTSHTQRLVHAAAQLVRSALHLPPPLLAECICACALRALSHLLPQLPLSAAEEAHDLVAQAQQLSAARCDSALPVALLLMERIEQALDEARRHERPPVRRWLCV